MTLPSAQQNLNIEEHELTPGLQSDQVPVFQQNRRKARNYPKNVQPPAPLSPTTTGGDNMAIEEAIKTEISYMPMKTPVSVLQELLSRRGITPSYELVQIEGAIHEPTFRYRVSFNDKDAMGAGRSKKEAKHSAAKALIDKLTGQAVGAVAGESLEATLDTALGASGFDDKVMGNPIGWLQEMCMARRWPPPAYETEMEVGLPHERQFTIACTVLKYREVGQGKSKKVAKRIAAHKMWTRLQDSPPDSTAVTQIIDEESTEEREVQSQRGRNKTNLEKLKSAAFMAVTNTANTITKSIESEAEVRKREYELRQELLQEKILLVRQQRRSYHSNEDNVES
ncbi:interferon-inducible double-stranded RNA-dependent protein kinase activator A homolog [Sergentomyia squamirostris]